MLYATFIIAMQNIAIYGTFRLFHLISAFDTCQKPVPLLERLIRVSSNPGAVVLDCFMGSGSTGVACLNTGRDFIGIEIDPDYFNIAKERIESEQAKINSL